MLAVVPASMAANSYNLLLFSSLDLSSLFFYNAINFSFSSSFATSATIATTHHRHPRRRYHLNVSTSFSSVNFSLFFFSSSPSYVFISFYYLWPSG